MYIKKIKTLIITGKDLKRALKIADITQMEAANRLGVARQTLINWINSEELSPDIVQNVHDKLKIIIEHAPSNMLGEPEVAYKKSDFVSIQVPVYDLEFSPGVVSSLIEKRDDYFPIGFLSIPEVGGCDAVIRAKGDSMAPRINDRDWIGIKKLDNWANWLPLGYIYAIITDHLQLIKYLKKGSSEDNFTIVSHNKNYEDDEIPKKVIKEVWTVKAILPFSKIETLL